MRVRHITMVLGLWLGLSLAWSFPTQAEDTQRQIVVTGEGVVQVIPDMVEISLGVAAQATSAQDAMDDVSRDVRAIFDSLSGFGVMPRDVQTTNLRLTPVFEERASLEQGGPEIRGFVATNDVSLRVRDLSTLGDILEAVVQDGANRLSNIRFTLQEPDVVEDEARRLAVADAGARAALYAEAAGTDLGPVLSIVENGAARPERLFSTARMAMDTAMPIASGELEVTAQVTVTYALAP